MRYHKFLILIFISYTIAILSAEDIRDMGFGVSNLVQISTGVYYNGMDYGVSNSISLESYTGSFSFGISNSVWISTQNIQYSDYRIVSVSQAPNPAVLEISTGGYGYAWFVVEGCQNDVWLPITTQDIQAVDQSGNNYIAKTGFLPYQFLTSSFNMQNLGVFALPISSLTIGNGDPEAEETVTVVRVNGQYLPFDNRQSIHCRIVPYEYKSNWGYRLKGEVGVGATAGVITGTGFFGGGSGATMEVDVQDVYGSSDWEKLRIKRRDDLFFGVEAELGPPRLIDVFGAEASLEASFPYETVYEFDYDQMTDLDAMLAYYLMAEPLSIYTRSTVTIPIIKKQISVNFLSWIVHALIDNAGEAGLNIRRVSDETGLDIEGQIDFSTDLLQGIPMGLELNAGLGAKAHFGASLKETADNIVTKTLALEGELNTSLGLGPRLIETSNSSAKNFYLHKLNGNVSLPSVGVGFELKSTWHQGFWEMLRFTGSLESGLIDAYYLPGQKQRYATWIEITDDALLNQFLNNCTLPFKMWNIGSSVVNAVANNETARQDFYNVLGTIYQQQNNDLPVQIPYGYDVRDKSEFEIEFDFKVPIAIPFHVKLGGGLEFTNEREYELTKGYWAKGLPYLQTEMPFPPQPDVEFHDVMYGVWNKMTLGGIWDQMVGIIENSLRQIYLSLDPFRTSQTDILNDLGSSLVWELNCLPAGIDSVLFQNWDWADSTGARGTYSIKADRIISYNQKLRQIREENLGMHYGIGGFFDFKADSLTTNWNQAPLLTIKYLDSEVSTIDETTLKVYWEDEQGVWHLVNSIAVPDSNLVRAYIPYFATYTLAPSLPQNEFNLNCMPDSLLADGFSTGVITSGPIYNNDGTVVSDGTLFTVVLNRGTLLNADDDLSLTGNQIALLGSVLNFTVQADSIPLPIEVQVTSVEGFAHTFLSIPCYQDSLPEFPVLLSALPEHRIIHLSWQQIPDPRITGYKIYYDTDQSGAPYSGTANSEGENSPVWVGNIGEYTLTGLNNDYVYYTAVTAIDAYGNESGYSNELMAQPFLAAASDLVISRNANNAILAWTASPCATSYKIYGSANPYMEIYEMEFLAETAETCWTDINIDTHDRYFYRVVAIGQ